MYFRKAKWLGALALVLLCVSAACAAPAHSVTDMAGRTVQVPDNAQHAACLVGPSFEKALMLGVADRVAAVHKVAATPWARLVYPAVKDIPVVNNPGTPNIEELMNLGTDFVLFWYYPDQIKKMADSGIPSVIVQFPGALPYSDLQGFIRYQKIEVQAIANAFGGAALEHAEKWFDYYDSKIAYVTERTSKIPEDKRPKVYYARSDEGLVTFSRNSYPHYLVEMAGGNYVAKDTPVEMNSHLTVEQIMNWDPDIIFMGRMNSVEIITDNPAWSGIKAVRDGRVYLSPSGVFNWDYGSENILLLLYLAKTIHPDLFADLDMEKEVHDYYKTFYGFELSQENVQRILTHQNPAAQ